MLLRIIIYLRDKLILDKLHSVDSKQIVDFVLS